MAVKITIDPGHTKNYNGGVVKGYYEGNAMFTLAGYLKEELVKRGFEAALTKSTVEQNPDLDVRGRIAVNNGSRVFLSLHSNAFSAESACGAVIFRSLKHPGSVALADKLGAKITELMKAGTGNTYYRGTQTRAYPNTTNTDYYGVIRNAIGGSVEAAFLIEHGFHTNTKECTWLYNEANLRKLAVAEAEVLAAYYGVSGSTSAATDSTSGYTAICGEAVATVAQMKDYLLSVNPGAAIYANLAETYLSEGKQEGIRGDIAFAQSLLETGNFKFGGDVKAAQNNFCGLGATGGGVAGNSFSTPQEGIRAQIQHLKAYASKEALKNACVDPRFNYVQRGCAPYVEWLGIQENPEKKGWASGAGYGAKILQILGSITGKTTATPSSAGIKEGDKVSYSGVLYGTSYGENPGKTVSGTYTVSRVIAGRQCGVLLNNGLGWVPEAQCKKV